VKTQFLVSVRNSREAADAVIGGADIVDVKEPRRGSLGRAGSAVWQRVAARIDGQLPVSVALGELLAMDEENWGPLPPGIRYGKVGLAGCRGEPNWSQRWKEVLERLPAQVAAVAVVYADAVDCNAPPPEQVVSQAARLGCWGVLFDTHQKAAGDLFHWLQVPQLRRHIESTRREGLAVALAGSLNERSLVTALKLRPEVVAVRSAVCRGGRGGDVDQDKVKRLAQIIKSQT
jgi:uncharacterized protein (UPF0264 family)